MAQALALEKRKNHTKHKPPKRLGGIQNHFLLWGSRRAAEGVLSVPEARWLRRQIQGVKTPRVSPRGAGAPRRKRQGTAAGCSAREQARVAPRPTLQIAECSSRALSSHCTRPGKNSGGSPTCLSRKSTTQRYTNTAVTRHALPTNPHPIPHHQPCMSRGPHPAQHTRMQKRTHKRCTQLCRAICKCFFCMRWTAHNCAKGI